MIFYMELKIVGCHPEIIAEPLTNIPHSYLTSYNEEDMIREVLAMDIGLFPATSDLEDYRIRGALKGLIYMSGGIPPVCLNTGDLVNIIIDGVNGFLINSEDE